MTEISELAASHRLSESHMRLLVATREGYQPLLEEKTEFPISPSTGGTVQKKARSPMQHLQPPAVPPRRSPHLDSGPDNLDVRTQTNFSSTLQRPSSTTPGGKHHKKSADSSGKYNTFSTREGHRGDIASRSLLDLDQRTSFCERGESQRRQNSLVADISTAESLGVNSIPHDHHRIPRPPSSTSDHLLDVNLGDCGTDNGAAPVEQDEHLVVASLLSPTKKSRSGGSDQGSDIQSDHQPISRQQSVARLCEYHLAKRISSLQGEAHSSLQGSLCSSLDAGGSTNSSACATPTDSPLGPSGAESKHHHLQRHPLSSSSSSLLRVLNYEDNKPGVSHSLPAQNSQGKELHPHADPALLRKMLPNIHPPATGADLGRPSSATPPKHKDNTNTASKRPHNDLHAKQQAYLKGLNQKEGSEAYRQLINYLTVSQMHQGGKLHSAGMGGAVKKDTRRFITSNPQLVEMVKNRSNTIARCPCMPSSVSSPFLSPNAAAAQLASKNPLLYHSATLPAKLKRSPDIHAPSLNDTVDFRSATSERRSSFSGLESELERTGMDPEHFLSLCKRDNCIIRDGASITGSNREVGGAANRLPPRSRSQPSGSTEDWFKTDQRTKHAVRQSPHLRPNEPLCFSTAPGGQRADLNTVSLGRGDHPSAFIRQSSTGRVCIASPTPIPPPPPPPSLPPPVSLSVQANTGSSNSGCMQDSVHSIQSRQNQNHIQTITPTLPQADLFGNNLQRGRELKRSSSNVTASSGSVDALFEKPSRSRSQQPLSPSVPLQGETKAQKRPTRKRLSKSYSQGSVSSHTTCWSTGSRVDSRRASVAFPLQKDAKHIKGSQKLDASPWRCNGPFSYCFFKRKLEGEEDDIEWERPRRSRNGKDFDNEAPAASSILPCGSAVDSVGEQLYGEVLNNMSFSDRLSRINALKDRMYCFPSGFTDVRRDASELIALVRSSIGRCDRGAQMPMQDMSQYKQLLSVESKELGRACRRMAQAHGSPEEMLLAVTCSFQVLCCLCEACMCLVKGLGAVASQQQREVVAKVDEVVMNYICLLKAAEAATVGAPGENSVKALVRHSSTMSAIANALTRSLKTLLSK